MSLRKPSKRQIQKKERHAQAVAAKPTLKPKPTPKKSVLDKPIGEKTKKAEKKTKRVGSPPDGYKGGR